MVVPVLVSAPQTVTLAKGIWKNELRGVGPGPTVMGTTLGPPAEKLWPPLDELLAPPLLLLLLLLEELLAPLLLVLRLIVLVPPPPPHAVKATMASSRAQRQAPSIGPGARSKER